jgi:hypothetical protein
MKAITFSSYTNAYALYLGCKELGVSLFTTDETPTFPIPKADESHDSDFLLFTEEASLRQALEGFSKSNFSPNTFNLKILDDKWEFVEWLKSYPEFPQGLKQQTLSTENLINYPCLVKAKHSWVNGAKLPRGWICKSESDLQKGISSIKKRELSEHSFFIQEWLGDDNYRVISACGFHDTKDSNRNLTAIVERIAAHENGLSCSAGVKTIKDEWNILTTTTAILDKLEFTGPYEMEYLIKNNEVKVLEFNPRFWMQHAIFLINKNGLIKRYLGIETPEDLENSSISNTVWIDGLHLIRSIAKLDFSLTLMALKELYLKNNKVLIWPSVPMSLYVNIRQIAKKISRFFSKHSYKKKHES